MFANDVIDRSQTCQGLADTAAAQDLRSPVSPTSRLVVDISYVVPRQAVLSVAGDLDAATTPELGRLLWPRLIGSLRAIVLDLSHVGFLGVAGLELLSDTHSYAIRRGMTLGLAGTSNPVDRALKVSSLDASLPRCSGVRISRTRTRPCPAHHT